MYLACLAPCLHSCQPCRLRRTRLIVWDEAGMSHKHAFEFLDRQLRDLCGVDSLFGGKVGSACILMQRILYVMNQQP
jgi:hypothetical protein